MYCKPMSFAGLLLVLAGVLVLSTCQLQVIHSGQSALNLSLRVPVPVSPGSGGGVGGRFLLGTGGTISVQISKDDGIGTVVFSQDVTTVTGTDGLPTASVSADNIPVGVPLSLSAKVKDAGGNVYLAVSNNLTLQGGSTQTMALTLAPDPTYPGLASLENQTTNLVIPAGGFGVLSQVMDTDQAGKHQFVNLDVSGSGATVYVLDAAGTLLDQSAISAPDRGFVFTPAGAGTVFFLVYNTATTEADLGTPVLQKDVLVLGLDTRDGAAVEYRTVARDSLLTLQAPTARTNYTFAGWYKENTLNTAWNFATDIASADLTLYARWQEVASLVSFGISLGVDQPSTAIVFSSADLVVAGDSSVALACSDATLAIQTSGWEWYVDGILHSGSTGGNFVFDPAADGHATGSHVVTVVSTQGGIRYSGSLRVTVTPVSPPGFHTITYSNRFADSGTAPVDSNYYLATGSVAVLAANTGNLARTGFEFLGWTQAGTGTNFAPGAVLPPLSADLVLYPRWSLVALKTIPGGTYQRDAAATNLTTVSGFRLGQFEITQEEYAAVMGSVPSAIAAVNLGARKPVAWIDWYEAIEFCNKLSVLENHTPVYSLNGSTDVSTWGAKGSAWDAVRFDLNADGYRLPTQSEWVWAAMGGLGDSKSGDVAGGINVGGYAKTFAGSNGSNSIVNFANLGTSALLVAGSLLPNELGLADMSGNAWEKSWDWFAAWPSGSVVDYTGPVSGTQRTVMGLGFENPVSDTTTWFLGTKGDDAPSYTSVNNGFRVARSVSTSRYIPRSGLVGEWCMDGNVNDTSGNGAGTSNSGIMLPMLNRKGLAGKAYSNATEHQIYAPNSRFGPGDPFTVSLWIDPAAFPVSGMHKIIRQNGTAAYDFQYWVYLDSATSDLVVSVAPHSQPEYIKSHQPVSLGVWTHVLITWTPVVAGSTGTLKVWINGNLVETLNNINVSDSHTNTDSMFQIGGGYSNPAVPAAQYNYAGGVDDVRMYNRVLSNAEIQLLYQE